MKSIDDGIYLRKGGRYKKYTFSSFIAGASNRIAYKAALDVAKGLKNRHNPFFITGGEGLGRTHLMWAIGNYILNKNPSRKVAYVSTERFSNDLVKAFQLGRYNSFRKKYYAPDIFLLDDLQFVRHKERTAGELIGILNELYKLGKQIVITSDLPPGTIFSKKLCQLPVVKHGAIVKIRRPEIKTRLAILKKKAMLGNYKVPAAVLPYLVKRVTSNIRALEGALIRVAAYASLAGKKPTLALAKTIMNR